MRLISTLLAARKLPRWSAACTALRCLAMLVAWLHITSDAATAGGWVDERASGAFVCRANFPLPEYDGLLKEIGQVQTALTTALGIEAAKEPVELYLFKDKRSYQQYLQLRFPQAPDRRALFIKGVGPGQVFVYRSGELPVDLRHESTHALLHASLAVVPLWLDEGLAEYFEVPARERDYRRDYVSSLKRYTLFGKAPRLIALEAKRDVDEMSAADYRDAWSWVHFMLHGPPEARDELVHFLADIRDSTPPGRLSERLEKRLPGLEQRWVQHFKTFRPSQVAAKPRSAK